MTVTYCNEPVTFIREVEYTRRGTRYPERMALIDTGERLFNRGPRYQLARMASLILQETR